MAKKSLIPLSIYKKILAEMPIATVDLLVETSGGFLVVKRKNQPAKDGWWIPGGRIKKWESVEQAAVRKAKEEMSIDAKVVRFIGVYDLRFPEGPFGIKNLHNIDFAFLMKPTKPWRGPSLGSGHCDYYEWKYFRKIDRSWDPQLVRILKDAGLK